jgi:hypothetical protein
MKQFKNTTLANEESRHRLRGNKKYKPSEVVKVSKLVVSWIAHYLKLHPHKITEYAQCPNKGERIAGECHHWMRSSPQCTLDILKLDKALDRAQRKYGHWDYGVIWVDMVMDILITYQDSPLRGLVVVGENPQKT